MKGSEKIKMVKGNIALETINKNVKLKVGMVIKSDHEETNFFKTINKFTYYGNEYLNLNPRAFVTIDISSAVDRGEKYSQNRYVNLNRVDLIRFCHSLNRLLVNFKREEELFYTNDGKLEVTIEISKKTSETIRTQSHKMIRMVPCVVHDEDNDEITYEGIVFCINSFDNFAYITYEEMIYMFDILSKLDLTQVGMQLLNTYLLTENMKPEELNLKKKPIEMEPEEEAPEMNSVYVPIKEPNRIPNI